MSERRQLLTRRGYPVYESNPSVDGGIPVRVKAKKSEKLNDAIVVAPETGMVLGKGSIGFIEEKAVDSEEFLKVYLAGFKKYAELSKAGVLLFEYVYRQMSGRNGKDKDTIGLNLYAAKKWKPDLTERTYQRGLKELLEKEFLFQSTYTDLYYVNVRYVFNGDRMILVQSYRRKVARGGREQEQLSLIDEDKPSS